jgi:hypothetical protein
MYIIVFDIVYYFKMIGFLDQMVFSCAFGTTRMGRRRQKEAPVIRSVSCVQSARERFGGRRGDTYVRLLFSSSEGRLRFGADVAYGVCVGIDSDYS